MTEPSERIGPPDGHDIRRQGMDAVADAFARLVEQIQDFDPPRTRPGPDHDPVGMLQIRAAIARAVDVYGDLFRRTFDLYADVLEDALYTAGATISGTDGSPLELAGTPGTRAQASVWVHNSTGRPAGDLGLRMTGLMAADGATIDASAGSFSPPDLTVAAGARDATRLSVSIPATAVPGVYHGHVLAAGLVDTSLPVRLTVRP
jgi:hypothetical protein